MERSGSLNRRRFLQTVGVGTALGFAGCSGLVSSGDSSAESGDSESNDGGITLPSAVTWGDLPDGDVPLRKEETVSLVNFFATWCKPCQREMPAFVELRSAYSTDELHMVSVTTEVDKTLIQTFWEDYNGSWPVVMDTELQATNEWSATAYPTNLLFDQQGELVDDAPGQSFEDFKREINPLLSE